MATRRTKAAEKKPAKSPEKKRRAPKKPAKKREAPPTAKPPARERAPAAKTSPGRPGELTPELARAICEDAGLGMPQVRCAEFAGIDPSTLSKWLDRGQREKSGPYREFWQRFREAQGNRYRDALRNIREAAFEDPGFDKWWLSRSDPANFGRRDNVGQADTSDRPEPGSVVAMLQQRLERLAQAGAVVLPAPVDPAAEPSREPATPAAEVQTENEEGAADADGE